MSQILSTPHCNPTQVLRALRARFPDDDNFPSLSTLGRWINKWREDNATAYISLTNPDEFKNRRMVAFGSLSDKVERLYQVLQADSTPADIMLVDGRHCLIALIDVYSRKAKILVSKTSKATAFALLLRNWIMENGVPESIKTDNGKDYASHYTARCLSDLGIEQNFSAPFSPWQKGNIERFFRTFSHDILELDPDFIGHNVAERQQLRAKQAFGDRIFSKGAVVEVKKTAAELQRFCDLWCENYNSRPHGSLDGKSPVEVATNWRQPVRRIENERALDLLLAEAPGRDGVYKIGKQGIVIQKIDYFAPVLGRHIGDRVRVRFDPHDLGKIQVYSLDFEFICTAANPERAGISRVEAAALGKAVQKEMLSEERKKLKKIQRENPTQRIAEEILLAENKRQKLLPFPGASETHETPMLVAAAEAAAAQEPREPLPERTPEEREEMAKFFAEQDSKSAKANANPGEERKRLLEAVVAAYLTGDLSQYDGATLDRMSRYSETLEGVAVAAYALRAENPQDAKNKIRVFREAIAAHLAEPHLKAI